MITQEKVLELYDRANPVKIGDYPTITQDPAAYLATLDQRSSEMTELDTKPVKEDKPKGRRGLLVMSATAAALVVIVGVVLAFTTGDGTDVASGDSRLVQFTFDGEQCTYEGPAELSAGDVEIVFHNQSSQATFAWFGRLDEGKTTQDIIDYNVNNGTGAPPWATGVWQNASVGPNASTEPATVTVVPGLHNLTCGTWSPYQGYNGGGLTVTP